VKNQGSWAALFFVVVLAAIVTWFVTKPLREVPDALLFNDGREVAGESKALRQQSSDFLKLLEWAEKK